MRPSCAARNFAYSFSLDTELLSYRFLCFSARKKLANVTNINLIEFRAVVCFAFSRCVPCDIRAVLLARSPIKIASRVVQWVAVLMAGFSAVRAWPIKSLQNKVVDIAPSATSKLNGKPRITARFAAFNLVLLKWLPYIARSPSVVLAAPDGAVRSDHIPGVVMEFSVLDHWSMAPHKGPICCI